MKDHSCQIILLFCLGASHHFDMWHPYLLGAILLPQALFQRVYNEKAWKKKWHMHDQLLLSVTILAHWQHQGLLSKPWVHHHGHWNGQQTLLLFHLRPWRPLGWYGASSCPMVASRHFWFSPEPVALDNSTCIAPMCQHGHKNGLQWSYIRLSPPPVLLDIIIDINHVMVHKN